MQRRRVHRRSPGCGSPALLALLLLSTAAIAREAVPTVTFVEGTSTIVSGARGFVPAAGVRLRRCDIVSTGPQSLTQVELDDGTRLLVGPDTRFLVERPYAGEPVASAGVLLSGWVKLAVPARDKAPPHRIDTPHFDLLIDSGVSVVRVAGDGGQAFVEQGDAIALEAGNARTAVGSGRTYSRKAGERKGAVADGVDAGMVRDMHRSLRDTLPTLLPQVASRSTQPKPAADYSPTDTDAWLRTAPELRSCLVDAVVRSAQETLERSGFSVGPIDGVLGPRTQAALRDFQQQKGLTRSGLLDSETLKALNAAERR